MTQSLECNLLDTSEWADVCGDIYLKAGIRHYLRLQPTIAAALSLQLVAHRLRFNRQPNDPSVGLTWFVPKDLGTPNFPEPVI